MLNPQVYAEVYAVLCLLDGEYLRKLPQNILDLIADKRDKALNIKIDENLPLEQQNLSNDAVEFLAMLKLDYWCETPEEKEQLQNMLNVNEYKKSQASVSRDNRKLWIEQLKSSLINKKPK
jgi:hypothetical protein